MKTARNWNIRGILVAACGVVAMLGSTAACPAQSKSTGLTVVDTEAHEGGDVASHSIVVRIDNGEISVIRDGEKIPHDRIKNEDGRIYIIDKDGKKDEIADLNFQDGKFDWKLHYGPATGWLNDLKGEVNLLEGAKAPTVMIGVHMGEPGPALEHHLNLEPGASTMIVGLYEGLAAHKAGLGQYDIIIEVDGDTPADNATIRKLLAEKSPGDQVTFTVIQKGKAKDIPVRLEGYDAQKMNEAKQIGEAEGKFWMNFGGGGRPEFLMPRFEQMPELRELFVAPPEFDMNRVTPEIMRRFGEWKKFNSDNQAERPDLEKQLDQLDQRMADLEKMIRKLVEQRGGAR